MTTAVHVPALTRTRRPADVPLHAILVAWVVGMLLFARSRPDAYYRAMQEDGVVEWLTVFLFLGAAVASLALRRAHRRFGDLLIALFCIVAAGEEISWGQRLFSYVPAETFLARNAQQEANLHNLVEAFGQPKWSLIAILAAYGIVLPILASLPKTARLLERTRTTAPAPAVAFWFAIAIVIEVIYPVEFTGEWVEAMVGALFLWGVSASTQFTAVASAVSVALAVAATALSGRSSAADNARLACARVEVDRIRDAMVAMGYPPERGGRMHRRLGAIWPNARVDRTVKAALDSVPCGREETVTLARRRQFGIDPWGNSYWVRIDRDTSGSKRLRVYSFGANRRRDHQRFDAPLGDDIVADAAPVR